MRSSSPKAPRKPPLTYPETGPVALYLARGPGPCEHWSLRGAGRRRRAVPPPFCRYCVEDEVEAEASARWALDQSAGGAEVPRQRWLELTTLTHRVWPETCLLCRAPLTGAWTWCTWCRVVDVPRRWGTWLAQALPPPLIARILAYCVAPMAQPERAV